MENHLLKDFFFFSPLCFSFNLSINTFEISVLISLNSIAFLLMPNVNISLSHWRCSSKYWCGPNELFFKLKNISTLLCGGPDSFWILFLTLLRKQRAVSDEVTHMAERHGKLLSYFVRLFSFFFTPF